MLSRLSVPRNPRPVVRLMALMSVLALSAAVLPAQHGGAAASSTASPAEAHHAASPAVQPGPTFAVTTTDDHDDGSCTDMDCTLREAIDRANNEAGANTIGFSVSGTITLAATLPNVADGAGLTIDGTGQSVTISGNNAVHRQRPLDSRLRGNDEGPQARRTCGTTHLGVSGEAAPRDEVGGAASGDARQRAAGTAGTSTFWFASSSPGFTSSAVRNSSALP